MVYLSFNQISIYSIFGAFFGCKMHNVYYTLSKSYNSYYNKLIRMFYYNYFINIGCVIGFIIGTFYGERIKVFGLHD